MANLTEAQQAAAGTFLSRMSSPQVVMFTPGSGSVQNGGAAGAAGGFMQYVTPINIALAGGAAIAIYLLFIKKRKK